MRSLLQAVERLNIKPRHFRDLLTDEAFTRADIIPLQDPTAPEKFDITTFYHVKNKISLKEGEVCMRLSKSMLIYDVTDDSSADGGKSTKFIRRLNPETKATLDALSKEYKPQATSVSRKCAD